MIMRALIRHALRPALVLAAIAGGGTAQDYPTHAITIIVPFTAGGPNDTAARVYADGLRRILGPSTSIVIENRPGAGGVPGSEAALREDEITTTRRPVGSYFRGGRNSSV